MRTLSWDTTPRISRRRVSALRSLPDGTGRNAQNARTGAARHPLAKHGNSRLRHAHRHGARRWPQAPWREAVRPSKYRKRNARVQHLRDEIQFFADPLGATIVVGAHGTAENHDAGIAIRGLGNILDAHADRSCSRAPPATRSGQGRGFLVDQDQNGVGIDGWMGHFCQLALNFAAHKVASMPSFCNLRIARGAD